MKPWQKWYFSRRGLILLPFYSVMALCFWNEYKNNVVTWSVGGGVVTLGILLRLWAIRYLGGHARKRKIKGSVIITGGPYALMRNPLYISNTLIALGFCVLSKLIWYVPILGLIMIVHYNIVVRCEEAFLRERFGEDYVRYLEIVPRWIPGLRRTVKGLPVLSWREVFVEEWHGVAAIMAASALMVAKEVLERIYGA